MGKRSSVTAPIMRVIFIELELSFQNPEFKILEFKILDFQNLEFRILAVVNSNS